MPSSHPHPLGAMKLKIISQHTVAPPPLYPPPPPLPLTYFDLFWYPLKPIQRVYFYSVPGLSSSTFLHDQLPTLKNALSLTLQRFHLVAGRLVPPVRNGGTPCLRYSEGDSVQLTVAEATGGSGAQLLDALTADEPKPAALFRDLVAPLETAAVPVGEQGQPVFAVQLTLFPSQGVAVGYTMLHVALDGPTVARLMHTWSAIARNGGNVEGVTDEATFDRSFIEDPGLTTAQGLLDLTERFKTSGSILDVLDLSSHPDILQATVRLSSADLDSLRRRVSSSGKTPRCSSFALATALVWTTILKARATDSDAATTADGNDVEKYFFPCDLRARLGVPQTYAGNLIGVCIVRARRSQLTGPDGLAVAASLVRDAVEALKGDGGLQKTLLPIKAGLPVRRPGDNPLFNVAGGPRLEAYSVDFGWGKPIKNEIVSIVTTSSMSLAESPDGDKGGLEIGVVLPAKQIHRFAALFAEAKHVANGC